MKIEAVVTGGKVSCSAEEVSSESEIIFRREIKMFYRDIQVNSPDLE